MHRYAGFRKWKQILFRKAANQDIRTTSCTTSYSYLPIHSGLAAFSHETPSEQTEHAMYRENCSTTSRCLVMLPDKASGVRVRHSLPLSLGQQTKGSVELLYQDGYPLHP